MSEWLTPAEFAARLRVHPDTVRRQCILGRLPGASKVGAAWRIDFAAYVEAGKARPPEEPRPRSRRTHRFGDLRLAAERVGL